MKEPVVRTSTGMVRGVSRDGVELFMGVPYAASPLGDRRFAKPEPHAAWHDMRDSSAPGPTSPQSFMSIPGVDITPVGGNGWRKGDDFLTANIWRPIAAAVPLPVMVFIHGGGFKGGDNSASVQDGAAFARSGILFFGITYRLGVEGFLPIPEAPSNLGLRDQIAALQWIRANAEAFGGDPGNITVVGHSAGASCIAALIGSPLAEGLFQRAIIQSGNASAVRSSDVARRLVVDIAERLGIEPTLAGFKSRTPEQAFQALDAASEPGAHVDLRDGNGLESAFGLALLLPVYGDDILPARPFAASVNGAGAAIDVLIGANREEMNSFYVPSGVRQSINADGAAILLAGWIADAPEILADYGLGAPAVSAGEALANAVDDLMFRWPARSYAECRGGRTFVYEFDWRSPACDGQLGAGHGVELPFVFNTLASCTGPEGLVGTEPPQDLADHIHGIWVEFARSGQAPWPEYESSTRQVYALNARQVIFETRFAAAGYLPDGS